MLIIEIKRDGKRKRRSLHNVKEAAISSSMLQFLTIFPESCHNLKKLDTCFESVFCLSIWIGWISKNMHGWMIVKTQNMVELIFLVFITIGDQCEKAGDCKSQQLS